MLRTRNELEDIFQMTFEVFHCKSYLLTSFNCISFTENLCFFFNVAFFHTICIIFLVLRIVEYSKNNVLQKPTPLVTKEKTAFAILAMFYA